MDGWTYGARDSGWIARWTGGLIGKKVEVSLRLFDIFERNRVFIFLLGSFASPPTD